MAWVQFVRIYPGTAELRRLTGKKVRCTSQLEAGEFKGEASPMGMPFLITRGQIGFLGNVVGADIIVAIPANQAPPPNDFNAAQRAPFKAARLNWATLQARFEVEA
jgi:hypothetical protein